MAGKEQADFKGVLNPRRVLAQREEMTMGDKPDVSKGADAGDLPGPAADFFKPRDASKRTGPPADMLKKHYAK